MNSHGAYTSFCPSCHNWWLFCDCIDDFGFDGEDFAQDENEEVEHDAEEEAEDGVADLVPAHPDEIDPFPDDVSSSDDMDESDDVNLRRPLTPTGLVTPSPKKKRSRELLAKEPYDPRKTPPDKPQKGSGYVPWKDRIRDKFSQAMDDVAHESSIPEFNPTYTIDTFNLSPVERDVAQQNVDGILDAINNAEKYADSTRQMNETTQQKAEKYVGANGRPVYMMRSPGGVELMRRGIPIFTGDKYTDRSRKQITPEFADFLDGPLTTWLKNNPDLDDWDVACIQIEDPNQYGGSIGIDYQLKDGTILDRDGEDIFVTLPGGPIQGITIKTDMKFNHEFLSQLTWPILESLTYDNGQGNRVFHDEHGPNYSLQLQRKQKGDTFVVGQTRSAPGVFVRINDWGDRYIGRPKLNLFNEGRYDEENRWLQRYTKYTPPPPSFFTNDTINTRRLTGTGTRTDPFIATFDTVNSFKFVGLHGQSEQVGNIAIARVKFPMDNLGDPNFQVNIKAQQGPVNVKIVHHVINEQEDNTTKKYSVVGFTFVANQSNLTTKAFYKKDGQNIFPPIYDNLQCSGNPLPQSGGFVGNTLIPGNTYTRVALIETLPNENTLNMDTIDPIDCVINWQFNIGDVDILSTHQLVTVNTEEVYFSGKTPVAYAFGEDVQENAIIPDSFKSLSNEDMSTFDYNNVFTKCMLWRKTANVGTMVLRVGPTVYARYSASATPDESRRTGVLVGPYMDVNFNHVSRPTVLVRAEPDSDIDKFGVRQLQTLVFPTGWINKPGIIG